MALILISPKIAWNSSARSIWQCPVFNFFNRDVWVSWTMVSLYQFPQVSLSVAYYPSLTRSTRAAVYIPYFLLREFGKFQECKEKRNLGKFLKHLRNYCAARWRQLCAKQHLASITWLNKPEIEMNVHLRTSKLKSLLESFFRNRSFSAKVVPKKWVFRVQDSR